MDTPILSEVARAIRTESDGGQDYEVCYEARKTRKSAGAVKKAVKEVGTSRKRVERRLGR
jgi:hypothetical protein